MDGGTGLFGAATLSVGALASLPSTFAVTGDPVGIVGICFMTGAAQAMIRMEEGLAWLMEEETSEG